MISVPEAFALARTHYQAGRLQQAGQLCDQIVRVDASHVEAFHLLGLIFARTGRPDRALDNLHSAIRLEPDFADAHNLMGIVFVNQRKPAEAVGSFREALRQAGLCHGAQ